MSNDPITRNKVHLSRTDSMQKRAYERHRSRVKKAAPTVDVNPPIPRPHVFYNAKRLQLQKERQAVITKDNFILLKNLCDIMQRSTKKKNSNHLAEPKSKCIRTR